MGLGDVSCVLTRGNKHCGNAVCGMGTTVGAAGKVSANTRDLPKPVQPLRFNTEKFSCHIPFQDKLRDDAFAASLDHVHRRMFLVCVDVARQNIARLRWVVRAYPLAGIQRCFASHVLARSVAGRIAEARVHHVANNVLLNLR